MSDELNLVPMTDEERAAMLSGNPEPPKPAVPPVDTPAPTPEPPKAEAQSEFSLEAFNKKFGTKFDKEDLVFDVLSKGTKYTDLELKHQQAEKRITEISESAKKSLNPRAFFSSDDAYMREQLLLKNKDKQDSVKYLSEISPGKIDQMADYDALKLSLLIDNPELDGGEAGAVELLNDKYNFDGDFETADRATKNRILLDAKAARKSLKSMFDGIEIPDVQDWESKVQASRDGWSVPAKELVDGISELKLSEEYSFVVDPSSKDGIMEDVLEDLVRNQVDFTPEALQEAAGVVRGKLFIRNMDKIIKHLETVIDEKAKERYRKEIHNDKPLNPDVSASGTEDLNTIALKQLTE